MSEGTTLDRPVVVIDDGRITAIGSAGEISTPANAKHIDFQTGTLIPSYLDIHIHGCAGHDAMEATPSALGVIGRFLALRGVSAYLPTTVTSSIEDTLTSLEGLANILESPSEPGTARPIGLHLEGPFLSINKRGVHPPSKLIPPSIPTFERFWQASRGQIRLLTIAPELDGAADLITYAASLGVRCSMGHSDANATQAAQGIAAGAASATHTFNAMRRLDHRDPGIAAVVLDREDLFAEIICDGLHVDPSMVRLFYKAKGSNRAILITDGMSATGMPDGTYVLGGLEVEVVNGRCLHHGVLAGSVLTLDRAVRNFVQFTHTDWATAVKLASENPARLLGEEKTHGALLAGRQADITVLDPAGNVTASFLAGAHTSP